MNYHAALTERTTGSSVSCVKLLSDTLTKWCACLFAERHSKTKVYANQYAMAKKQLFFLEMNSFYFILTSFLTVPIQLQMHLGVLIKPDRSQVGQKIKEEDISAAFSQGQEITPGSNVFWLQSWLLIKPMTVSRWAISGRDLDTGPGPLVVKIRVARL